MATTQRRWPRRASLRPRYGVAHDPENVQRFSLAKTRSVYTAASAKDGAIQKRQVGFRGSSLAGWLAGSVWRSQRSAAVRPRPCSSVMKPRPRSAALRWASPSISFSAARRKIRTLRGRGAVALRPIKRGDLGIQRRIRRDLVEPAVDRGRGDRHVVVAGRRDLDDQHVGRLRVLHQADKRRIGAKAAVPIGFAVDLDRAMDQRRAGRGQQHVGGHVGVAEDLLPCRRERASPRSGASGRRRRARPRNRCRSAAPRAADRDRRDRTARRSVGPKATELPAGEKPPTSISERNEASFVIRFQNCAEQFSRALAAAMTSPQARSAALTAPTLAPLMASKSQSGSSSSRSSTPQVNAPNEPPPCRASDSFCGGQARGRMELVFSAPAAATRLSTRFAGGDGCCRRARRRCLFRGSVSKSSVSKESVSKDLASKDLVSKDLVSVSGDLVC